MFIDFKSKKVKTAIRLTVYAIMVIVTVITTLVLVYFAKGYRFDSKTRQVVKDGLLLVDAEPVRATIAIDNKMFNSTPKRYALRAGDYHVKLSQDGYRSWQKEVHVAGSTVEWVHYPRLIPKHIETVPAFSVASPEIVSASPNNKRLFVRSKNDTSKLAVVYPLSAINKPFTISWPDKKIVTQPKNAGTFTLVEWAPDNKHIMLKHALGTKTEFISVDTTKPNSAVNVTNLLSKQISQPHFKGDDVNQLYAIYKNNLYLFNIKSPETKPKLLVKNIHKYVPYGNSTVLYAAKKGNKNQIGILNKDTPKIVQTLPYKTNRKYTLGYREYSREQYFVVGVSDRPQARIYKNPLNSRGKQKPLATLPIQSPDRIDFSTNSQFVSIQDGNHFAVFNFDTARSYIYNSNLVLSKANQAWWMDDGHLQVNKDGKIYMWDFDNTNTQYLGQTKPGFKVIFADNYAQMWTLGKSSVNTKTEVMVSSLIADKDPQAFLPKQ